MERGTGVKRKAAAGGKKGKAAAAPVAVAEPTATSRREAAEKDPLRRMHVDDLSSDDEAPRNTIGDVPVEWYKDYDHIGYDVTGAKIAKKDHGDRIDAFLKSQDDPLAKWRIYDEVNDEEITLSKRDVQLLRNLHAARVAHPEFHGDAEAYSTADLYSRDVEVMPLNWDDAPKRRFVTSKWEVRGLVLCWLAARTVIVLYSHASPPPPHPTHTRRCARSCALPRPSRRGGTRWGRTRRRRARR